MNMAVGTVADTNMAVGTVADTNMVQCVHGQLMNGGTAIDATVGITWFQQWYPQPVTVGLGYYYPQASKLETAFKVVAKLLENKVIEELTVKRFIELVNDVAQVL